MYLGALRYPSLHGCLEPRQLRYGLSGASAARRHAADRPAQSTQTSAQPGFDRSAARPRDMGRNSRHRAYGDWPMRSPAGKAMAVLRLRACGALSRSGCAPRPVWLCKLYRGFRDADLVALFATSNDYSLRALGTRQWKQLQRWNYVAAALVAMHAFGYQGIEKQRPQFVAVVIACVIIALALQCVGFQMPQS